MARVAKARKSTKSVTPPREPGRSLTVTATKPAKTGKPTLSTRSRAAAPIEKRKPGRPAKGVDRIPHDLDKSNEDGLTGAGTASSA